MDKMKRIFSFVLVFAMLVGSFSSFSTIAFAEEVKKEEVKVEEVKDTEVLSKVPSDVKGTEYEKAVTRLVAFGVIGGYPDGSYKPEEVINRAQFAKIVVVALGLNDAVPAAAHKATGFSDVQPGYWAAGYINVASGQGLLKGYPDGTFKPANQVSYAEALTILVRALGYQDEFLAGRWPGNYVAKAAEVGITKGVKLPTDAANGAKRGPVALLVNNAFDAKVVKVDTYKPNTGEVEYYETDIPLLKEKLEISKYEDTRIIADKIVDDGLEKDELRIKFLKEINKEDKRGKYSRGEVVKKSYNEGETDKYRFDSEFGQPRPVIGEEVTTYINDNDKVVYIERENDDKAYFDYIQALDGNKLDLVAFDKAYDFEVSKDDKLTANVFVFRNKDDEFKLYDTESELKDLDRKELVGKMGKVVVRNNKIVYAEILDPQEANPFFVVMKNDSGQLEGINNTTNDFKMDLRDDKDYDGVLVYNTKGEKLSVKDIKKGNVLYVQEQSYDGDDVAFVTVVQDNEVTGEMGRVKTDKVELAGKEYKVVNYKDANNKDEKVWEARYAVNDIEDIREWLDSDWEDDMEDAYKENVVAYKDGVGRIAFLTTEGAGTSGYKYGIVTRTYADGDRVRIFTTIDGKEGKDQIFKADKERDIVNPYVLSAEKGKLGEETKVRFDDAKLDQSILGSAVKFRLNNDGEIQDGKFFVMPAKNVLTMSDDFGKDVVKTNEEGTYAVNSDATTIIDAETAPVTPNYKDGNLDGLTAEYKYDKEVEKWEIDIDDFDITTWKDIKEDNKDDRMKFFIFPKGNNKLKEVDGMVFVGKDGANTGSDEIAVYVLDQWKTGDKLKVEYVSYENNTKQTREVDNEDRLTVENKEVEKETAYVGKEKSNGKIGLYGELGKDSKTKDFKVYRGHKVTKVNGNYITLDNGEEFLTSGALIYDEDKGGKSASYLKDKYVDLVSDGIRARVVGVVDGASTSVDPDVELGKNDYTLLDTVTSRGNTFVILEKDGKETQILVDESLVKKDKDGKVESIDGVAIPENYGKVVTATIRTVDGEKVVTKLVVSSVNDEKELAAAKKAAKAAIEKAGEDSYKDVKEVKQAKEALEKVLANEKATADEIKKATKTLTDAMDVVDQDLAQVEAEKAANKEKVNTAKAKVEAAEASFAELDNTTDAAGAKTKMEEAAKGVISDSDVTTVVTEVEFKAPTAGVKGSYKFTVELTAGTGDVEAKATTKTLTVVIAAK